MNRTVYIIAVVVGLASFLTAWAVAQSSNTRPPDTATPTANVRTAQSDMKLYDVRTPEEFKVSRAEGATLLPLASIQDGIFPDVKKDDPIGVYCRSGNRSQEATSLLKNAGYTNVTDLGGIQDLSRQNIRIVNNE